MTTLEGSNAPRSTSNHADPPASGETPAANLNIRMFSREVDSSDWGVDAPMPLVRLVKESVRDFLLENGFQIRQYVEPAKKAGMEISETVPFRRQSVRPTVEAFYKSDVPFRQEPILIDDGGRTVQGRPVLSIAIRPTVPESAELVMPVAKILLASGIHPSRARRNDDQTLTDIRPEDALTYVFRIRRLPGPGFGGQVAKALDGLLEWLTPRPNLVPAPQGACAGKLSSSEQETR